MKNILRVFILLLIVAVLVIFFPRQVEHGIVINQNPTVIKLLINNKTKSFKASTKFPKLTVVNFKYNLLRAYSFKEVAPISDRIMIKDNYQYDLETLGKATVSNKANFYSLDNSNNITISSSKNLIVGKPNVKYFKDKSNQLKTFLVFPSNYSTMRVGLSNTGFSSTYHDKVQLKTDSVAKLYSLRENLATDIPKNTVLIVEREGKNLKLTINNKTVAYKDRIYLKGDALTIQSVKRGSENFNPTYSGVLEFNILENGMNVINEVDLEDYLRKVVPSEMPATGGLESLKCQAIAARTYAISDMLANRFANLGFYVDDSTRSQVYNNTPMQSLSTQAVNTTKGMIMTYNNLPIDAKYYSTSAGTGVDYQDVWFNPDGSSEDKPYIATNNYLTSNQQLPKSEEEWLNFYKSTSIKAIDSDYPYFRWKIEYSSLGFTTALNKTLKSLYASERGKSFITVYENSKEVKDMPELKELQDTKILKRGAGGIVMEISFIFSNATVNVRSDSYIRSSIKCNQEYTNEPTALVRHKGNPLTTVSSLPSAFFSVEKKDGKFIVYGGGFGHGAGMSQYGAIELSKNGVKFDQILNTFYKNVKLETVY
ncbi:SpoIID/LytB domain-containing protein [Clostridium swellfunianum]|uniref:SpoIID/LytB domain-containing protein n=1 Tax=Clostridium swellfunianum TaxID=1367462 RepID=UPI002030C2A2|nr:SpoIID/LytB domain-containing protein [Clostridium swellfunianum]MCM0647874.1 SpoIID/LytB domain-containing protein [Clostridium swellfunianum]